MSRNVDKANSVLVRFQEIQAEKQGGYKDFSRFKRPKKIYTIKSLSDAQRWRSELLKEIGNKTTKSYDPSLNDLQLEDLNENLNKLFAEKKRWEIHIKNLGGPDYRKTKTLNSVDGVIINGKRYFGRVLELPHVQKLLKEQGEFKQNQINSKKKVKEQQEKIDLWKKTLNGDYYGELNEIEESKLLDYEKAKFDDFKSGIILENNSDNDVTSNIIGELGELPSVKDVETWLVKRRKIKLQKNLGL